MTTLNINGRRIKVGDDFKSLSPDQQAATVEEIVQSLNMEADPRDSAMGKIDAGVRGVADFLSLGMADEIAAGLGTGFGMLGDYGEELERQRGIDESDTNDRFGYRLAGQLAGGVAGGVGLARQGLSMGANAAQAGQGLGRVAMGSAADGAILGGLHGVGSGEGAAGRAQGGVLGGVGGGVLGAAAPYAIAGASAAGRALTAPVMARMRPEAYANRAIGQGLRRSGMSVDDVAASLSRSQADDQGMFTVADAMGNSGQRMLSTATRTPNDMRQTIVDTLTGRQMGQGERLSRSLARGFNAPDTAAQRQATLGGQRSALANVNYENARAGAGAVDVSGALGAADDILQPGVNPLASPQSGIADDSIEGVVRRARALLTDGRSNLTDFDSVLRAKQDISDMIQVAERAGRGNQARLLGNINRQLDAALERSSEGYRSANDAFRAQSRTMDAVDTGRQAASSRTRAQDNIQTFQGMQPGEQNAFRAGYVDPYIARVEAGAMSPTTNRARSLMTEKTNQEFPAFAVPQRADRMGREIAREQRMFETTNAAMGGSRTADNLADAAEMNQFDPEIMTNLMSGRPVASVIQAVVRRFANEAGGMPPRVVEQVARALLETDPTAARQMLQGGAQNAVQNDLRRAIATAITGNLGAGTTGRLGAGP